MASKKKSANTTHPKRDVSDRVGESASSESESRRSSAGEDLSSDTGTVDRGANTDRSQKNFDRSVNQDQESSDDRSNDNAIEDDTDSESDLNR